MCSINHNKKAVFIHIPKNGGSYIADILSKNYEFKNYYIQRPDHHIFTKGIDLSVDKHENKLFGTLIYYKTSNYINNIMNMNEYKWNTYFIFTFIRNPYDRIVSGWNYVNKYNIEFKNFINFNTKSSSYDYWHVFMQQYKHIIDINNKIRCNFIGQFENLEIDLKFILNKLGYIKIIHIPFKKNSKEHKNYKIYYENNEILEKVNNIIKDDLYIFKYEKINDINLLK